MNFVPFQNTGVKNKNGFPDTVMSITCMDN